MAEINDFLDLGERMHRGLSKPADYVKRGCKISPSKKQAAPKGAACKIFLEEGLVQWKNQPFGGII